MSWFKLDPDCTEQELLQEILDQLNWAHNELDKFCEKTYQLRQHLRECQFSAGQLKARLEKK